MATPVEWLGNFQVNTGTAATGTQSDPHIIGLANGNILVAWTESADGAVGASAGTDIVGKIYDAEGNLVRDSYQINSFAAIDNENDFDLAATNDGGWVMAYIDNDISAPNRDSVIWERRNANGDFVDGEIVADENVAADFFSNPQITVDLTNNLSFVSYTDDVGANTDINARTVTSAGVLSAEFAAAQNGADFDRNGDSAVLSNGNFVTVYEEDDAGTTSIEFKIVTSAGALVNNQNVTAGPATDPHVASLAGGGFVVVWTNASDIFFRVCDSTGAFTTGILTAASGADLQNEPDVVALVDGGFVISWDDDTDLHTEALRFTAAGVSDGFQLTIQATDGTTPDLSLTADGRILSVSRDLGGAGQDIFASIWDPRGAIVNAGDYDNGTRNFLTTSVITGGPGATTVNGDFSNETLLGQGGNDTINGDGGFDSVRGGGGADLIRGGFGTDTIDGGGGNDTIAVLDGENIDDVDGGTGSDTLDLGAIVNPAEAVNVDLAGGGAGTWTGLGGTRAITGIEVVLGTQGNDTLDAGGAFTTTLDGGFGNDLLNGGLQNQTLLGGSGDDTITSDATFSTGVGDSIDGGNDADSLIGAGGNDTIIGGSGFDTVDAGDGDDSIDGGLNSDTLLGGLGNDTIFAHAGLTSVEADSIVGGGGDDSLTGATAFDTLIGGAGLDTLRGREGADSLSGGGDVDQMFGELGKDFLDGGNGADALFGGGANDTLRGGSLGDALDGGAEIDWADYSTAAIKVLADLKTSGANTNDAAGDTYVSIENLRGSAGRDTLNGDDVDNILEGLDEKDQLAGRNGDDTLIGGAGKDVLKGGNDADRFVLDDISSGDRILDMTGGVDEIALENTVFGLPLGALAANRFVLGNAALDANDRLIYDQSSSNLFFDADGNGAGAQVFICKLVGAPSIDANDFIVI